MKKVYKYGASENNFVTTPSLKKYRNDLGLSNAELAGKLGESKELIATWVSRGRVPKVVLQKLGIRARGVRSVSRPAVKSGGDLYVCYIGASEREPFVAFCNAMKIDVKAVL